MRMNEPIYETWYVMEDGTYGDPCEIALGEDGRLAHSGGLKVAMRDADTPRSRSVQVDAKGKLLDAQPEPKATTHMEAEKPKAPAPKQPYRTRESKAKK